MRFSRENTDRSRAADSVSARGWSKSLVQAVSSGISSLLPGPKVADTPSVSFIRYGYDVVRIIAAAVLLVAAGLKTHQLATEPILGTSILDSRWLLMATVEFELFFGLWLLSNIMPRATWMSAIGLFGLFTCVSLYKALSGAASCGCFGRVAVNPWYTTTLDLAIVFSLLRWRPRHLPSPACGRGAGGEGHWSWSLLPKEAVHRATVVILSWLAIGLPAAFAMGSYTDTTLSDVGQIVGNGKIIVLEPEKWIGERFPLLDYIDIGDKLRGGSWIMVLYRHDCPDCRTIVSKFGQLSRELAARGEAAKVALIELPPYDDRESQSISHGMKYCVGRLNNAREWIVATPLVLVLERGVVNKVGNGKNPPTRIASNESWTAGT